MGTTQTALRPADLMNLPLPEGVRHFELSDGELIPVGTAGARHERIKSRVLRALLLWSSRQAKSEVYSESMFTLGEQTARIPDVAVILAEKVAAMPDADVPIPFAPDLAVEVVSSSESAWAAEKKVREYLSAGVREVWQVFPEDRAVHLRSAEGARIVEADGVLTSAVLDGFEVKVESFFL